VKIPIDLDWIEKGIYIIMSGKWVFRAKPNSFFQMKNQNPQKWFVKPASSPKILRESTMIESFK
jgi:hypothetical protein